MSVNLSTPYTGPNTLLGLYQKKSHCTFYLAAGIFRAPCSTTSPYSHHVHDRLVYKTSSPTTRIHTHTTAASAASVCSKRRDTLAALALLLGPLLSLSELGLQSAHGKRNKLGSRPNFDAGHLTEKLPTLVLHPASAALAARLDPFTHLDWPVAIFASCPRPVSALALRPRYCTRRRLPAAKLGFPFPTSIC